MNKWLIYNENQSINLKIKNITDHEGKRFVFIDVTKYWFKQKIKSVAWATSLKNDVWNIDIDKIKIKHLIFHLFLNH